MKAAVLCGTNSSWVWPLSVTFPFTRKLLASLPARAKRSVGFPEPGGPTNRVILPGFITPLIFSRMDSLAFLVTKRWRASRAACMTFRSVFQFDGRARSPT
ncbi:hypothetical protein M758_UG126200 [Ceratodon purpureus]|uniref:Uncharacterized protein n=1 Tax=Ceratodon purpureus TaxID=3225 RepID=A0A8T0HW38_CERPU|nr:hypothetical protein KC19_VG302000 [Ceratodon purpureus]KAG0594119.1 hypothetical protein M758_UG049600 [Ceratodon purpureus]KAG0594958.1 hypothetical protein M758_UG126200 [Ceratodon purpureus]